MSSSARTVPHMLQTRWRGAFAKVHPVHDQWGGSATAALPSRSAFPSASASTTAAACATIPGASRRCRFLDAWAACEVAACDGRPGNDDDDDDEEEEEEEDEEGDETGAAPAERGPSPPLAPICRRWLRLSFIRRRARFGSGGGAVAVAACARGSSSPVEHALEVLAGGSSTFTFWGGEADVGEASPNANWVIQSIVSAGTFCDTPRRALSKRQNRFPTGMRIRPTPLWA